MGLSDTHSRKSHYSVMLKHIHRDMTPNEATKTLETIDMIAGKSHVTAMNKNYPNFMGVINHCLAVIDAAKQSLANLEFAKKYPNLNKYIVLNKDKFLFE